MKKNAFHAQFYKWIWLQNELPTNSFVYWFLITIGFLISPFVIVQRIPELIILTIDYFYRKRKNEGFFEFEFASDRVMINVCIWASFLYIIVSLLTLFRTIKFVFGVDTSLFNDITQTSYILFTWFITFLMFLKIYHEQILNYFSTKFSFIINLWIKFISLFPNIKWH